LFGFRSALPKHFVEESHNSLFLPVSDCHLKLMGAVLEAKTARGVPKCRN
jgi:hypothetical protein